MAMENGDIDARHVVDACADAIMAHEHELHVFAHLDLAHLRTQTDTASGPLAGLPVGIKDIFDTFDLPTEYGSPIYADHRPHSDAALVSLCRQAGLVLPGKAATTEFAFLKPSPTRNPHNLDHTPGGSSSGSAAGVAAGFFPVAIGTQTGGSMVRPASYCGVSGFKPSFRLLPTVGMKCFSWSLDTSGLFAGRARDTAGFLQAITGRQSLVNEADTSAPKIGIIDPRIFAEPEPAMADALLNTRKIAQTSGAQIAELDLSETIRDAIGAHETIQNFEGAMACADDLVRFPKQMSEQLRATLNQGVDMQPDTYDDARKRVKRARNACRDLFSDIDVILLPSATGVAPKGNETTGSSVFNRFWTMMGTPSINVPGLYCNQTHLPLGMQLIGRFGADAKLLQAAHWLENQITQHSLH